MTGPALSLVLLLAVSATAPHVLSRGGLKEMLVRLDAASTAVLLGLWHAAPMVGLEVGEGAACGLVLAMKVVLFAIVVANPGHEEEIEWSPARAGMLAALVYLALIPNMLSWHIDGDESFYVLSAESIVRDFDLDLRNQYSDLSRSMTGRVDLAPQLGDPVGPGGEIYSRHEPLLSFLLVPGLLLGGLAGALVTIAVFAALAVRSTTALLAEEGAGSRMQLLAFGFVFLAPPFLNYAIRIWPEALGALLLAEMLRATRGRRFGRLVVLGILLSALKLRFAVIAIVLLAIVVTGRRVRMRWLAAGAAGAVVLAAGAWLLFPGIFVARLFDPRQVFVPDNFARGLLGLLLDGQAGMLFQAPLFLLALAAVLRWRGLGDLTKLGCLSGLPYLVLLLPRSEWHGGWSPPLRYLIVFTPVLVLLLSTSVERVVRRPVILIAAAWTALLAAHAVARPPGQFRIASGESALAERLSGLWGTDFTSLVPSLIRPNEAAMWAAVILVLSTAFVAFRRAPASRSVEVGGTVLAAIVSALIAAGAWAGTQPGRIVEFEDAHVQKRGGELYPERWTVARFRFQGGWTLKAGDALEFRHRGGIVSLEYYCDQPTVIAVDGVTYDVPTGKDYADLVFRLEETEENRHEIRCVRGALILDRLTTE